VQLNNIAIAVVALREYSTLDVHAHYYNQIWFVKNWKAWLQTVCFS